MLWNRTLYCQTYTYWVTVRRIPCPRLECKPPVYVRQTAPGCKAFDLFPPKSRYSGVFASASFLSAILKYAYATTFPSSLFICADLYIHVLTDCQSPVW